VSNILPTRDQDGAAIAAQIKNAEADVADGKSDGVQAKTAETFDHLRSLQGVM
jgi:hypothetical protein